VCAINGHRGQNSVTCKVAKIAFTIHMLTQTHSFFLVLYMTGHSICFFRTIMEVSGYWDD